MPEVPGFAETAENSIRSLVFPSGVFGELSKRPAPSASQSLLLSLSWTVLAALLILLDAYNRLPANSGLGVLQILMIAASIFTGTAAALAALGGALVCATAFSGGKTDALRSLQVLSAAGAVLPAAAAAFWLSQPLLLLVPTLWAAWISAHAVEKLHEADAGQTWLVIGSLGIGLAGAQIVFQRQIAAAHFGLETALTLYAVNSGLAPEEALSSLNLEAPEQSRPDAQAEGEEAGSSLNMIGAGDESGELRLDPGLLQAVMPLAEGGGTPQLGQGLAVLQGIQAQLKNNPNSLDGLPPEQKVLVERYLGLAQSAANGDMSAFKNLDINQVQKDSLKMAEFARSLNAETGGE